MVRSSVTRMFGTFLAVLAVVVAGGGSVLVVKVHDDLYGVFASPDTLSWVTAGMVALVLALTGLLAGVSCLLYSASGAQRVGP